MPAERPSAEHFARALAKRHGDASVRGEPLTWWLGYGRGGNAGNVYARDRWRDYLDLARAVLREETIDAG